ncbi:MAG: carbamoyl-phosphate synthase large subunit [Acidobacteria bacterium]|nr:MAG: carbamoyl-phosphate synthase large subunit [Acidobacteriota bacterium]REK01264.1 MAG: carbamoyl-phosphate synthase large subunit [Acidobacteriota bacterium]REK14220.1 MAG: carbamoyl-phosphate synthase large subunit [Acidobacteriota bacterium]REK44935.1 MAG: carbamoyl-phosphate synthase large subunit [Acidobacteriota bacterium]
MPKRTDIKKILIIGSGPIVIGQACEFDYSGTQACRALRQEGFEVVLVNSNPATIMTDPEMADKTYIEPLTVESVTAIIEKEKPDALLPTVGGQTGLNLSVELYEKGVLKENGVQLIGANVESIRVGEDRELFKNAMDEIGILMPKGDFAHSWEEAQEIVKETGYPAIIRPAYTLGGTGGGTAYNPEEFEEIVERGLSASPVTQVLIEESILGWKEFELEVMRDLNDNVVIICSIENFDPMGVHTGDSITVAPAQTLTDVEYQKLRDMSIACIRKVGVETGGSNIQFAVNPENGEIRIIEMNPRVSRSSALASKATGFPIAKIAAKLAVGYTLDEIPNDITKKTPASFEPTIDYVVTKIPKWAFEKFPGTEDVLGTQMKSVGEVMAIGRTFKESLFKGLRSLEAVKPLRLQGVPDHVLQQKLARPNSQRFSYITYALQHGYSIEEVHRFTKIDPWFLDQLVEVMRLQDRIEDRRLNDVPTETVRYAKEYALSDRRIAFLTGKRERDVRERRKNLGIVPVYKRVDTCGAEFESHTPYLYSTYEEECESEPTDRRKIMILGSGPNRIGQGIEFDYCCCHASFALSDADFETIMVNCNPETVSTDYDTSDRLYFEPLTFEDVMNIVDLEKPEGVIVQFGGQTPLNLSTRLHEEQVPIIGTSPDSIDLAEDRKRFSALLADLNIPQPANGTATSFEEASAIAEEIGYPVIVRPSFVLGGRAMATVYDSAALDDYMRSAVDASPEKPILIDKFLERAVEIDVDALADETGCVVAGIQEHIEEAGIHSGDSSSVLPPQKIAEEHLETICHYTKSLAEALKVKGLMNIQYAIKDDRVYVIEVNPRASRTVPFVSKATGVPLAKYASLIMAGANKLTDFGLPERLEVPKIFVKSPVFPFKKFSGVDPILGPEMHSTGEVMGVGETFGEAYGKAMEGAFLTLPKTGKAFISVNDDDKGQAVVLARRLARMGFDLIATYGTANRLREVGLDCETVFKVNEGRPNIADHIKRGDIALIINTPLGRTSHYDEQAIRKAALQYDVPAVTTITGAEALIEAIATKTRENGVEVRSLQDIHAGSGKKSKVKSQK